MYSPYCLILVPRIISRTLDGKVTIVKAKSPSSGQDKFTKALASVLSASPEQIQDSCAQAKAEKPSPHKKYKYVPEEGHS